MSADTGKQTLGKAIDEVVAALQGLDTAARLIAIRAAAGHLAIPIQSLDSSTAQAPSPPAGVGTGVASVQHTQQAPDRVVDIRSFKEAKQPASAREMACVVAYYLDAVAPAAERKQEITTVDLEKYYKQAGYPLPKKLGQVLIDAKAAGYFDATDRGTYRLNAVGHNLVVHSMPRGESGRRSTRGNLRTRTKTSARAISKKPARSRR